MKTVLLVVRYIIINGIFAVSLYYGFFEGVNGAKNVALFFGWVSGIFGTFIFAGLAIDSGKFSKELAKSVQPAVPFVIDLIFDMGVLCIFVWFGHYILGMFYLVQIVAGKKIRDVPKKVVMDKLKQ